MRLALCVGLLAHHIRHHDAVLVVVVVVVVVVLLLWCFVAVLVCGIPLVQILLVDDVEFRESWISREDFM